MRKTRKYNKNKNKLKTFKSKKKRIFTKKHYMSGDGMLTTVWGPSMWHYLHTMSFNYPICPSKQDKKNYKEFIYNLTNVLPCKYCRKNLISNLKAHPLKACHLKNRETYSRYVYNLHEIVNKMLNKKSGLSYCDVRERYEHFRSRCVNKKPKIFKFKKTKKEKEKGCTEPLYGQKAKCVIKIVPQNEKCKTLTIDKQCIKNKINI